jgi:hypothetical protein
MCKVCTLATILTLTMAMFRDWLLENEERHN